MWKGFKRFGADQGKLRASQVVKNLPASARDTGDLGSSPGSGKSPGGGHGNALQYSYLENPMERRAWRASPESCKELDTTEVT